MIRNLETRLLTWTQELTWKHLESLGNMAINLEILLITWQRYYQINSIFASFQVQV